MKKLALFLSLSLAFVGCNRHSKEFNELTKNGRVHDAQIMAVDSLKGQCSYAFVVEGKEYNGTFLQRSADELAFKAGDMILVVYLPRDPSINRRLKDN